MPTVRPIVRGAAREVGLRAFAARHRDLLSLAAILAAIAAAFGPVLRAGFFWDDTYYVVRNAVVRGEGTVPLSAVFTTPVLGHWHPLTIGSLALDHAIWGLDPVGFHLTNLLLHLANVSLVYALARRWSGSAAAAWVTALLFGIHPLRVEPVAWVASRKDLLAAAFVLAAIWFYETWTDRGDRRAYAAAIFAFVLGVLSKGSAVALALLLPVTDFLAGRPLFDRRGLTAKLPFVTIAIAGGAIALIASIGTGAAASDRSHGPLTRAVYASFALTTYLGKTFWPTDLSVFHPYPNPGAPIPAAAWAAPAILLVVAALAAGTLRRTRVVAFGLMFFAAAVVLMLRPLGGALLADRYTYLAAVGLAYIAGAGYAALSASRSTVAVRFRPAVLGVILLAALALGAATWQRALVWRDSRTLWDDVLAKYPDAWAAWHARAGLKAEAGDRIGAIRDLDEAIRVLPTAAASFQLRADLKADLGDAGGALEDYAASIRADPNVAETHYNKGYVELEQNHTVEAIASFTRAVALDPRLLPAWFNRAEARARSGDAHGAVADYGEALRRDPGYAPALYGRAKARFVLGDVAGAAADVAAAARLGFPIEDGFSRALAESLRR